MTPTRKTPRLLSRFLRVLRAYFIGVGILVTLVTLSLFALVYGLSTLNYNSAGPEVRPLATEARAILNLHLSGKIQTSPISTSSVLEQALSQLMDTSPGPNAFHLRAQLSKAADDKRIHALFVELHSLEGSLADFDLLRNALLAFKKNGKKIFLWSEGIDTSSYHLASIADKLYLHPAASITLFGPLFQLWYLGGALTKLGIEVDVVRTGNYKSAFEGFISNRPSPATQEMFQSLTADGQKYLVEAVHQQRPSITLDTIARWFKQSLFDPPQALSQGMVDELAYADQAKDAVQKSEELDLYDFTHYEPALTKPEKSQSFPKVFADAENGIALIEALGEFLPDSVNTGRESIQAEPLHKQLQWAEESEQVKAVVLYINSPGGAATAADLIWHDVERLALKKPLVVSMGSVAASAGYYIAAPAHKIFALPTTLTGSIGVIALVPNISRFEEKYGFNLYTFTGSERAHLLNPSDRPSNEDKQALAARADFAYQRFASIVAKGRELPLERVHALAQGRVWSGRQAKENGLVDELGDLYDAFQEAKNLAGFDPETLVPILQWPGPFSSLPYCLSKPRSCMQRFWESSLLTAPEGFGLGGETQHLSKLSHWLSHSRHEPVQAFWPGYWQLLTK